MAICGKDRWLRTTENLEQDIAVFPTRPSGNYAPPPASVSLNTFAIASPCNLPALVRPPRRLTVRNICLIPRIDAGFSATLRDLQDYKYAAAWSRATIRLLADPQRQCNWFLRARPIQQTRRSGIDSAMDTLYSPARRPPPCHLSQRLRHAPDGTLVQGVDAGSTATATVEGQITPAA